MAAVEGDRVAGRRHCGQCIRGQRPAGRQVQRFVVPTGEQRVAPVMALTPIPCAGAAAGPQLADSRRLGPCRQRHPAAGLPGRVPQLRHDLRARLGTRTRPRGEPRLRRRPASHAAPARRPARHGDDATRQRRDRRDDGDRLHLPRPGRLPRLPPRRALVRPPDRRRSRPDRPNPRPLPIQRPARLRRPPLHRPLPRRPPYRDQEAPSRLARPRPARSCRPAPPRGLGLLDRLLALRPSTWARAERAFAAANLGWRRSRCLLLASAPLGCSGCCSTGSPRAARPTRSPAPRKPSKHWSARPAQSTSSSTDRAASAKSCSGREWSAPSAASSWASPSCDAARPLASPPPPSPSAPSPCSAAPAWRSSPATRCSAPRSWRSSSPSPCSAGACSRRATRGAAAGRPSPGSSP